MIGRVQTHRPLMKPIIALYADGGSLADSQPIGFTYSIIYACGDTEDDFEMLKKT